jgi:hypothetical protein
MTAPLRTIHGFQILGAIQSLGASIGDGSNLRNTAGPVGGHLNGYMTWIRTTELRLVAQFRRSDVETFLLTPRYWDARRYVEAEPYEDPGPAGWIVGEHPTTQIVIAEATARIADLQDLLDQLKRVRDRYISLDSPVLVPDTSAFLHYTFFLDAPWHQLVSAERIHLAIPLVVVEELDRAKFSHDSRIEDRARKVIRALDSLFTSSTEGVVELPGRGTIEVLSEQPEHIRLPTNDAEIVQVCDDLTGFVPATARIATGDLGMKVRARTMSVAVTDIPETWRWPLERADASSGNPPTE